MNDTTKKHLSASPGWRRGTGDGKSGRRRALFAPFTHQRPDKLPRVRKRPALPCPFAGQTNRIPVGNCRFVKQKHPDREIGAFRKGFKATTPKRRSTRDHCQFSLSWNWCLTTQDVFGDKFVLPSKILSHPYRCPSCRKPCWNWNCLRCWRFFLRHLKAERHREEDRWDGPQDVVTWSALCRRRHPGPLLRPRNQSPCSEPPSFGSWDWRNRRLVWERFFGVLPAPFLRRTGCRTPRRCRGRRMTV